MVNLPFYQESDPMAYKIERRILEDAPHLSDDDVITIAEAARELGVSHSAVNNLLVQERLTTVLNTKDRTAYLRPRRLVLKVEVERLKIDLNLDE
jgi:hypothetical protein